MNNSNDVCQTSYNSDYTTLTQFWPEQERQGKRKKMENEIDEVLLSVKDELIKANKKFPMFNSAHEGFAVLKEEVDELWDDVKKNRIALANDEAIQVAAMAVKFIISNRIQNKIKIGAE